MNREQRRKLKNRKVRMADESAPTRIRVNDHEVLFPPPDLTMGEMCDAEELFGVRWDEPQRSGVRLTAAMLWIAVRRLQPTVTVDDIRALDPGLLRQLEGDARPPVVDEETNSKTDISEPASEPTSDPSDSDPSLTGPLGSDIGSVSDPVTSPV